MHTKRSLKMTLIISFGCASGWHHCVAQQHKFQVAFSKHEMVPKHTAGFFQSNQPMPVLYSCVIFEFEAS